MVLGWIIAFSILGSIISILVAAGFVWFKKENQDFIHSLISYATGALLAAALIGLMPEALHHAEEFSIPHTNVFFTLLIGIVSFFVLEKLIIWRHCHDEHCDVHKAKGSMILIGDAVHNLIDGVVIAASFLISIPVGIAVALSTIAHEIPQEVGDFGILLHSGYKKKNALILNILSGMTTLIAAIISYFALETFQSVISYVMAFSAASFLYIALVDLSPVLHQKIGLKHTLKQFMLVIVGICVIIFVLQFHSHG